MLLTRPPRAHILYCYKMLRVRLACVKHAASVRSEPGSNSRLKLIVSTVTCATIGTNLLHRSVYPASYTEAELYSNSYSPTQLSPGRLIGKPNGFWLVSFDCQRAGTPRPAGRTTDNRQFYRRDSSVSIDFRCNKSESLIPVREIRPARGASKHRNKMGLEQPPSGRFNGLQMARKGRFRQFLVWK